MNSVVPPLAGLCSYAEGTRVGYGVDHTVTLFHDFDWADEVLHTQIARKWLKSAFVSNEEMQQVFEAAVQGYDKLKEEDMKLARANWWGDFYRSVTARQTGES